MKIVRINICIILLLLFNGDPSSAEEKGRSYFERTGDVIWDVNTDQKLIALTFDDGPHPVFTPQLLDLLSKYDAKATFFVIGEHAEKYPELVSREFREGHEIGNHSYSHLDRNLRSAEEFKNEIKKTDQIVHDITGYYPAFFRPPGGNYNEMVVQSSLEEGHRVIMWSWHQDSEDWRQPGETQITRKVFLGAHPGDVILFHDGGGNRSQTIRALSVLIPALKHEGYEFVTISEMLQRTGIDDIPYY